MLLTKYCLGDEIKNCDMVSICGIYWGQERCIQGFGGEPREQRLCERPRHRWEDNIKMRWEALFGLHWLWIGTDGGRL